MPRTSSTSGSSRTAWWDLVVPPLAGSSHVIRVDLLGHGKSGSPAGGYDIPAQASRVGADAEQDDQDQVGHDSPRMRAGTGLEALDKADVVAFLPRW